MKCTRTQCGHTLYFLSIPTDSISHRVYSIPNVATFSHSPYPPRRYQIHSPHRFVVHARPLEYQPHARRARLAPQELGHDLAARVHDQNVDAVAPGRHRQLHRAAPRGRAAHRLQVSGDAVAAVPTLVLPAYPVSDGHSLVGCIEVRRGVVDECRADGRARLAEEPPEAVKETAHHKQGTRRSGRR